MIIRRMIDKDLDVIDELEKEIFTSPWSRSEYLYGIHVNPYGNPHVLIEDDEIVAYFDYWIIFDRAEIATIGVKKNIDIQDMGKR